MPGESVLVEQLLEEIKRRLDRMENNQQIALAHLVALDADEGAVDEALEKIRAICQEN